MNIWENQHQVTLLRLSTTSKIPNWLKAWFRPLTVMGRIQFFDSFKFFSHMISGDLAPGLSIKPLIRQLAPRS